MIKFHQGTDSVRGKQIPASKFNKVNKIHGIVRIKSVGKTVNQWTIPQKKDAIHFGTFYRDPLPTLMYRAEIHWLAFLHL